MERKQLDDMSLRKEHLFFYDEPLLIANKTEISKDQKIINDLRVVDHIFINTPSVSPVAGFSARWQTRLVQCDVKKHRQQTIKFLIVLVSATILVSWLFFGQLMSELRWLPMMVFDKVLLFSSALMLANSILADVARYLCSFAGIMLSFWLVCGGLFGAGSYLMLTRRRPRAWLGL